jgi:HD superfamily phosphohydrolase
MSMTIGARDDDFEVVRDPLWNTIRIDPVALRIIDTSTFQRLRHVRQLGHAFLVYPGATHTRFDHALGVYHLARRTLRLLGERRELDAVDPLDRELVPFAALLHDVGHYPFSHALEELGVEHLAEHHEVLTARFLKAPDLAEILAGIAPDAGERIERLVRGRSESPLQGLVAGSLDLDKIEYLNRDALFCGVPYGSVDVDRLIHALALLADPETGRLEIGIHEKGLSALESLLFAKYQMFRNVYWHHAVRAATALFKRTIQDAVEAGLVTPDDLIGRTDEGLLSLLEARAAESAEPAAARVLDQWIPALRYRRLPKRAVEIPGDRLRGLPIAEWFYSDPRLRARLEDRLAAELGLSSGSVLLDYPEKPRMMGLDLLLLQRSGEVKRLPESGRAGLIDLPRVADGLYHSARVFRVFTLDRRELDGNAVLEILSWDTEVLRDRVLSETRLL